MAPRRTRITRVVLMVWLIGQVLLIGYLPGALLLRAPGRSRAYRAGLPADERVFWSVLLSVVWSTMAVLALAAMGRYAYNQLLLINAVASGLVLILARQHIAWPTRAARPSWAAVVPACVVLFAIWLYSPPSEYVIGGRDPGTYVNEGIQIAQRGRLVIRDEVIASVPPPFRDLFFPSQNMDTHYGLRFMGFFIQDPGQGAVVGQWPHFYPSSIAIGYGLNGLSGARQTIGVWAVLGLLAVYYAGTHLFGRVAAGAAMVLLSLNVVMIWFARYPNSELPMQALLFATLLAASHGRGRGSTFFAVVAGALLGVTLFGRYETLLAILAFAAAAVLAPVSRQRLGPPFGIALMVCGGLGGWYLADMMRAYSAYPIGFVSNRGGWFAIAGGIAIAAGTYRVLHVESIAGFVRKWLPATIAVGIVLLAAYAYFLRDAGGRTALGDAMAFRTFGWYITPWFLAVAVIGAAFFVARDFWRDPTFFLTFLTFSTFFFYKTRIVPEHFWTSRRFLGVALPGAVLLATAFVSYAFKPEHLARITGRAQSGNAIAEAGRRWMTVASVALVVLALSPVALAFHRQARPVRDHIEYAGLIPHLEQLAARVGDRDLLIIEGRNAGTDLHVFAMPLAYIYARNVLVLDSPAPEKRTLEQFVSWAGTRYDNVLFLGGGGTDLLGRQLGAAPLWADRFQVPEYDTPINQYPTGAHAKEFEFGLYRLIAGETPTIAPIDLQIGGADDLNVVRFHARERRGDGLPYRWSTAQSFVVLMGLHPDARELTVWMADGGRPRGAPAAVVEFALDDEVIGTATAESELRAFTFGLTPSLVERLSATRDPVRLRMRVATWSPAAYLGGGDTRDLGVIVTRVQTR